MKEKKSQLEEKALPKHASESPATLKDWAIASGADSATLKELCGDDAKSQASTKQCEDPIVGVKVTAHVLCFRIGDKDIQLTKQEAEQLRDLLNAEFPAQIAYPYIPATPQQPANPWTPYPWTYPYVGDPVPGYPRTGIWYASHGTTPQQQM